MSSKGHSFLRHAAIYLLARGLPGMIAFLAIPLFTRLLDPAGYGKLALVNASVMLAFNTLFQGLQLALVRYLPAHRNDPAKLKSTLLTVALLVIAFAGLCAGAACLLPAWRPLRPVIAASWLVLALTELWDLFAEYYRGQLQPWRFMAMQAARSALAVGVGAGLMALGAGWWGALAGMALSMFLPAAFAFARDWREVRLGIDREILRAVLHYGVPLSLTVALSQVIVASDRYVIAVFKGEEAAGLYSASVDFTFRTLTLAMMVVYTAMFPLAVRAWEQGGHAAARERMRHNASALLAIGLPSVAGLGLLAGSIAQCFMGKKFSPTATAIMPLVALSSFLAGFKNYHWDAAFQFVHRTIYQVWIVLAVAVLNIGLNLLAVPRLGINGSAGASVLALSVSIGLTIGFGRRQFKLPFPLRPFLQILLATALMSAALLPLRPYRGAGAVAMQVAAGVAVYGAALLAVNFLGIREMVAGKVRGAWAARGARSAALVGPSGSEPPEPVAAAAVVLEGSAG